MKRSPSDPSLLETGRPSAPASVRTKIIEPAKGWRMLDVGELWRYRELLGVLVLRDVKVRYKQSVLGVAWVILRPLTSIAILTLVFGTLARIPSDGYPYPLFVFAALLPWIYFSNAVASSGGSLVASSSLIGKVYFPRLIVPMASVAGGLVDLLVSMAFLLLVMPFFGLGWSLNLLAVPPLVLAVVVTALGVGTLFSALTVAYRDFGNITGHALQLWMFATPVVYPASLVPGPWRFVLHLNPMAAQVEAFRSAFLGRPFDTEAIGVSLGISAALFVAGVAYFEKVERRFADII